MEKHIFHGKWITDSEFADLEPRNVYFRELTREDLPCDQHRNRHILFRKRFELKEMPEKASLYITADDYYKLYINGEFVTQGPAPSYPSNYGYNMVDVTPWLKIGANVLAVHTLYQGLVNRVWVSGDNQHGLICDLVADGEVIVSSDESFLTAIHSAYQEIGTTGYDTQFLENYDSAAAEVGFQNLDFDDSGWKQARQRQHTPYSLVPQSSKSLVFESIVPAFTEKRDNILFVDFGSNYVGYLDVEAQGVAGSEMIIRCGQELNEDGTVRYALRSNCNYEEPWKLSGGLDQLDWYDYKSFRYAELVLPEGCEVRSVKFRARHYPFELKAGMNPAWKDRPELEAVWNLCVRSQKYGIQEMIMDCMEREKGFYVGDGCYTTVTNLVLTGDDSMVRKLIDDAFYSAFISPSLMTCLNCSFMQEIAEYSLMLISLILWHYRLTGDRDYLKKNYAGVCKLLDTYREEYERDYLLSNLDKWCVVEWPDNFRDGYDVDLTAGRKNQEPHVAMNAYYIEAIRCANAMAQILGLKSYRDETPLVDAFVKAFYDPERKLFKDSTQTSHISYIGNVFAYAFRLSPEKESQEKMEAWIEERGVTGVSMFGSFPLLCGLIRHNRMDLVEKAMADPGSWGRIIREGGTTTFEGWGKDTKWNTSLFHLALSDGALFLSDVDLKMLFS